MPVTGSLAPSDLIEEKKRAKALFFAFWLWYNERMMEYKEYFVPPEMMEESGRFLPDARSLCVLLAPWRPYKRRQGLNLCAYYPVENALYHAAKERAKELGGVHAVNGVNIKAVLERAGIAARGHNDLMATREYGSYFAAQLILCYEEPCRTWEMSQNHCIDCNKCEKACPGSALPMTDPKRCVRWWMDGMAMPDFAMEGMRWLFGCELCQNVCPRNAHITPVDLPEELAELLTYERMIFLNRADKQALSALVGKNLLTRGRVQAQALALAYRQGWPDALAAAKELQHSPHEAIKSAAEYIIRNSNA